MCTVLLPPGVNIQLTKYISNISYISCLFSLSIFAAVVSFFFLSFSSHLSPAFFLVVVISSFISLLYPTVLLLLYSVSLCCSVFCTAATGCQHAVNKIYIIYFICLFSLSIFVAVVYFFFLSPLIHLLPSFWLF